MTVKAKFKCNSVTNFGTQKQAKLSAIYGKDGENKDFTNFTPAGELSITIQSDAPASEFFVPNKDYYLTFSEADNPANKEN